MMLKRRCVEDGREAAEIKFRQRTGSGGTFRGMAEHHACPSKFDPRAEAGFPRDERETRLRADRAQKEKDEILMRFNFDRIMR
jgi:hypothetical protein